MFQRLTAVAVAALLTLFALPVFADDGKAAEASVAVLEFETFNVDETVLDDFYASLQDAIDEHEKMRVIAGGGVDISDLVLTLGCDEVSAACLSGLDEHVEGDRIVFGSIEHAEGVYMVTMQMFDFERSKFVREIEDETVETAGASPADRLEVVIDAFLYGDVGHLEVTVDQADGAVVLFDGDELGEPPLSATKLPLGEHVVTLRTADGDEETKKATLRRGSTSRVHFRLGDAGGDDADADAVASQRSSVPGWLATGAGAAGLAFGIVNSQRAHDYDTQAARMLCGDALCAGASAAEANQVQQDMDTAYTMSVVGYSVAAVGLAAGGYLLYDAYSSRGVEREPSAADESTVSVDLAPSTSGASLGLTVDF